MPTLLVNCLLVLLFVLVGGLFAASEMALVSLRPGQVQRLSERGGARGRAVARLVADENNFLSSVQVGVTLAGFFSASFGAAQISPYLAPLLRGAGMGHATAATGAFIGVTVLVSYLSLVLGELVPKRLAMQSAEGVALALGAPLALISRGLRPIVWFLGASTDAVLRILGRDPRAKEAEMSPDEVRQLLADSPQIGALERRITGELLAIQRRRLAEVMTPRTEVAFLSADLEVDEAARRLVSGEHSRYPVTDGSSDDVLGYLHVRDLLGQSGPGTVRGLVRPLTVLPESRGVLDTLASLREAGDHIALVLDEYGGTAGIVTLEDLVEEFLGDITDEFDADRSGAGGDGEGWSPAHPSSLPGLLNRAEAARALGTELPEGPFDTLAGYVVEQLGRVAVVGDEVPLDDLTLTVASLDGRRVESLTVRHGGARRRGGAPVDVSTDPGKAG